MAEQMMKMEFQDNIGVGLKRYFNVHGQVSKKALGAMGLQMINNIVNGSPKEPVVPPKLMGFLRASGSVFVGSDLVGDTNSGGAGKPNKGHSDKENVVTVGFDAPYTARMHENTWTPGPVSKQSGNVGNKFIEKHLVADGEECTELYAAIHKKEMDGK